jgi:hypothetical protein
VTPQELLNLTADDIERAITLGVADEHLREIEYAIKRRQRAKGAAFRSGQRVKLNDSVRPQYLIGTSGVVRKVNQKRCVVDFDTDQNLGRFAPGIGITVPFDMLEEV